MAMSFDFSTQAKRARAIVPVPKLVMEGIRQRSHRLAARNRLRMVILYGILAIALLSAGMAVAQRLYHGVSVWLLGNKAAVTVRSLAMVREPMASDLQAVVTRATFPVVFPVGLPAGSRVTMMLFAPPPPEGPDVIEIDYRDERSKLRAGFTLVDSVKIGRQSLPGGAWRPPFVAGYQWQVRGETVLVPKFARITARQISHIETAMKKTSLASSLAVTDNLLPKIMILGAHPERVTTAELLAQPKGSGVLLDPTLIPRIPMLAREGKPVVDDRTIYLTDIPAVKGEPDYSKAKLRWPRVVAIRAPGVKAIAAVLRFTRSGNDCSCVILLSQPNNTTYRVMVIPLSSQRAVGQFSVNSDTLEVTVTNPK